MEFPRIILAMVALLQIALPSHGQQPSAAEGIPQAASIATAPKTATALAQVLAPNDVIEIKVFQEKDLDTTTRISDDGKISFPLIGEVAVGGRTVQQATRQIRDRLEARFLIDPQVSLTVVEHTKRLFTVLGQVQRPGTYRFPDREVLNLIQVIGIAGGYTRLADPARVTIKRRTDGKETVIRLDAKRMARDETAKAFDVAPGDIITVGERFF